MIYDRKRLHFEYRARIIKHPEDNVLFWLARPQDSQTQKIHAFNTSMAPHSQYTDNKNNTILFFDFIKENSIEIGFTVTASVWKQKTDLSTIINKKISQLKRKDFEIYLQGEKYLEQTNTVRQLAYELSKDADGSVDVLSALFSYVKDSFSYEYPVKKRGVENLDFSKLSGDCAEYAGLFVSLCRALHIPAKNVTGYVIHENEAKPSEHGWASVFVEPEGWIDLDPQYASIEPAYNYFLETPDYRFGFVHGFNVPLTPQPTNQYSFQYWDEQGLPIEHAVAQTLQPIVFASKKPVKLFEEYITKLS